MNPVQHVTVETSRILLVEDDADEALLAQRAFTKANIWNPVDVVRSAQEALDYLNRTGSHAGEPEAPAPLFILVDLNMPGMDGRELILRLQGDPRWSRIPLVILSTSDYEKDIEFGRRQGVHHYIIKPLQPREILAVVSTLPGMQIVLGRPLA